MLVSLRRVSISNTAPDIQVHATTTPTPHFMAVSRLDLAEIARRLVASEAGPSADGAAVATAVEDACARLGHDLGRMIGAHGVSALLARALNLAKRDHPLLAEVTLETGQAPFRALPRALDGATGEAAADAGAAILANLWALLVSLLGDELGMQPVYRLWPHLAPGSKEIVK